MQLVFANGSKFKYLIIIGIFFFVLTNAFCNGILGNKSELEKIKISQTGEFSFLVAGHIYGQHPSGNNNSVFPASSIISFFQDSSNFKGILFFVSLGDNVYKDGNLELINFKNHLLNQSVVPFIGVRGNHDGAKESLFGDNSSFYDFNLAGNLFIVLDSEMERCVISGDQFLFLKNTLSENIGYKRVFIFMHRDLFLFKTNPNETGCMTSNWDSDIVPLLASCIEQQIDIYVFSGDYREEPNMCFSIKEDGITYVHTNIYDNQFDKIIRVNITDEVTLEAISLTGGEAKIQSNFSFNPYWQKRILRRLDDNKFWEGVVLGFIIFVFLWSISKLIKILTACD